MAAPVKLNYKIYQGSTFKEVLRWESPTTIYKLVSNISKSAPAVITTSTPHFLPVGWRFKITDVVGMKEINSTTEHRVSVETTSTDITIDLNSFSYSAYVSGGVIEYKEPVDLTGYTGRMQIRETLESSEVILELTTENGGIVLDSVASTITISLSASQTEALTFESAVYSLEMVKSGEVVQLVTGSLTLEKEVTR